MHFALIIKAEYFPVSTHLLQWINKFSFMNSNEQFLCNLLVLLYTIYNTAYCCLRGSCDDTLTIYLQAMPNTFSSLEHQAKVNLICTTAETYSVSWEGGVLAGSRAQQTVSSAMRKYTEGEIGGAMHSLIRGWGQWDFALLQAVMREDVSKVRKEPQGYLGLLLPAQSEVRQQQMLPPFKSQ